jgi:hypothetical protein
LCRAKSWPHDGVGVSRNETVLSFDMPGAYAYLGPLSRQQITNKPAIYHFAEISAWTPSFKDQLHHISIPFDAGLCCIHAVKRIL